MRTEVYYFDENGHKVTDEKLAGRVIIRELDDDGNLVKETFGQLGHRDKDRICEFTREEIEEALAEGYELDFSRIRIVDENGVQVATVKNAREYKRRFHKNPYKAQTLLFAVLFCVSIAGCFLTKNVRVFYIPGLFAGGAVAFGACAIKSFVLVILYKRFKKKHPGKEYDQNAFINRKKHG